MAPAGNNKFSQDAMNDTFFLSNIVPQVSKMLYFSHVTIDTSKYACVPKFVIGRGDGLQF